MIINDIDTESTITRTSRGPVVEANGAKFQMTVLSHENRRHGLRTVITTWHTDADVHNGGHPAGTVVTRIVDGDARKHWTIHRETLSQTA